MTDLITVPTVPRADVIDVSMLKAAKSDYYKDIIIGSRIVLSLEHAFVLELMDRTFSLLPEARCNPLFRVVLGDEVYFIGVQLAHLTKRTTYNLYRAMRAQGVACVKATPEQLRYYKFFDPPIPFVSYKNARSLTFIPVIHALEFFSKDFCRTQTGHYKGRTLS